MAFCEPECAIICVSSASRFLKHRKCCKCCRVIPQHDGYNEPRIPIRIFTSVLYKNAPILYLSGSCSMLAHSKDPEKRATVSWLAYLLYPRSWPKHVEVGLAVRLVPVNAPKGQRLARKGLRTDKFAGLAGTCKVLFRWRRFLIEHLDCHTKGL